jgi:nucleotide-binding universal stress UspA family protein
MKIMVCYDGSNVSKEALRIGIEHARAFDAKLFVIMSMMGGRDVSREEFQRAEKEVEYAESIAKEEGISCESRLLVRGLDAGEDLVEYARENDVDEMIMGVRRRSKVGKLIFGSTAQYVVLKAPCPVVTVR